MPFRRATLAALALAAGLGLASCGGGSDGSDLVLPTTTQQAFPGQGGAQATGQASRGAMMANLPMSRRLLSGRFRPPPGFRLQSVNPSVPLTTPAYGAVQAVVTSPTGVEYVVTFGPTTVPCIGANCPGPTRSVPVGSAAPVTSSAVFAPDIGRSAECGYDSDAHVIGCDTIVNDEYTAVRGNASRISTTDAVALLRAAVAYVLAVSGDAK